MKGVSIRVRLTLWYMLFFMLLLGGMGSLVLWRVHAHLMMNADRALAEEIHELFDEMQLVNEPEELVQEIQQRFSTHSHYHFQVLDQDLNAIFTSRFLTNIPLPQASRPSEMRGAEYIDVELPGLGKYRLMNLAVRDSKSRPLLLRALSNREPIDRDFRSYFRMFATLGPIAIAAAILAGYLIAGHVLSPIKRITAKAKSISAERLNERLPVIREFDELGELSKTLNDTFDRLGRSVDTMRRFTSDAAHELRSPVAVLRTEAEIALRKPRTIDEYRSVVETTLAETIRLGGLVEQLLSLSRFDAGVEDLLQDEVLIDALMQDVVSRLAAFAGEKGVCVRIASIPDCVVNGHDVWLSQLFYNLIENAIKFTPTGGEVTISAVVKEATMMIDIQDNGVGIPPEHLSQIFERFYRVDGSRAHHRGTGLGLSICKSIAEAHGGTIEVSSELHVGSTFRVSLPRKSAARVDFEPGGSMRFEVDRKSSPSEASPT